MKQNNKNVTEAKQRIAKIIRDQQAVPEKLNDGKKSAQQKSRNAAIPMSKSDTQVGSNPSGHSPKTLLLQQQKKLTEQNSNAAYHTAGNIRSNANYPI